MVLSDALLEPNWNRLFIFFIFMRGPMFRISSLHDETILHRADTHMIETRNFVARKWTVLKIFLRSHLGPLLAVLPKSVRPLATCEYIHR